MPRPEPTATHDPLFDSAWLKWTRAILHARTLERDIAVWSQENPNPVRAFRADYDAKRHGFAIVVEDIDPVPVRWRLLLGDIASGAPSLQARTSRRWRRATTFSRPTPYVRLASGRPRRRSGDDQGSDGACGKLSTTSRYLHARPAAEQARLFTAAFAPDAPHATPAAAARDKWPSAQEGHAHA